MCVHVCALIGVCISRAINKYLCHINWQIKTLVSKASLFVVLEVAICS